MEKKEILERLNLMKDDARRMRSYTNKHLKEFLEQEGVIFFALPIPEQIALQNYYGKLIDLNKNADYIVKLMRDLIHVVENDDDNENEDENP